MSPKTKLLIFAVVITALVTLLLYSLNIQLRSGYYFYASVMTMTAILIYALLLKMANKIKTV